MTKGLQLVVRALPWLLVVVLIGSWSWWHDEQKPITSVRSIGDVSTTREGLERRIAALDARLAQQPDDLGAAVQLAQTLLRQTRVVGNPGLAMRAEEVLRRALRDDPGNYDVNRLLGELYLSQHRFREAIAVGERNRDARPLDPINYGVIGDGHIELGEYEAAFDAFDRMMQLRPSAAAYARVAYARELQGSLTGALESMKLAVDATAANDPEGLAWHLAQVGELYLQLGKNSDAKQSFAAAAEAFPGHPFAVLGFARALEADGDRASALKLLRDLAARTPTADVYMRLAILLEADGSTSEAAQAFALAEAALRSDTPEPKNLARLLADRGVKIDEAVHIAEGASADRDDIFTNDALAWAYFKANRVDDARKAIARALRTGTKDATIRKHAAAIRSAVVQMASR